MAPGLHALLRTLGARLDAQLLAYEMSGDWGARRMVWELGNRLCALVELDETGAMSLTMTPGREGSTGVRSA